MISSVCRLRGRLPQEFREAIAKCQEEVAEVLDVADGDGRILRIRLAREVIASIQLAPGNCISDILFHRVEPFGGIDIRVLATESHERSHAGPVARFLGVITPAQKLRPLEIARDDLVERLHGECTKMRWRRGCDSRKPLDYRRGLGPPGRLRRTFGKR